MTSFAALEKIANGGSDPSMMQTPCLIETGAGCRIKEAPFRLPSSVWREMMDLYYPNSTWLRLRRDTFDRLHDFKQRSGMATWEEAIESLLPAGKKQAAS